MPTADNVSIFYRYHLDIGDTRGKITVGAPWPVIIYANFWKIWSDPNVIFRVLGEDDSWKKPKAKILWQCPFNRWLIDIGHEIYDIDVAMFYIVLILSIYQRKWLSLLN